LAEPSAAFLRGKLFDGIAEHRQALTSSGRSFPVATM
jgi:hypothetical protein